MLVEALKLNTANCAQGRGKMQVSFSHVGPRCPKTPPLSLGTWPTEGEGYEEALRWYDKVQRTLEPSEARSALMMRECKKSYCGVSRPPKPHARKPIRQRYASCEMSEPCAQPTLSLPSAYPQPTLSLPSAYPQPTLSLPSAYPQPTLSLPSAHPQPTLSLPSAYHIRSTWIAGSHSNSKS